MGDVSDEFTEAESEECVLIMGNEFKSIIEYKVEYGNGLQGYGWKITVIAKNQVPHFPTPDIIVYVSNLSEVRTILEGNLLRLLNNTDWSKL